MPFNDVKRLQDDELSLASRLKDEDVMQLLGAKPSGYGSSYQPSDEERQLRAARLLRQQQNPGSVDPVGFARPR